MGLCPSAVVYHSDANAILNFSGAKYSLPPNLNDG